MPTVTCCRYKSYGSNGVAYINRRAQRSCVVVKWNIA